VESGKGGTEVGNLTRSRGPLVLVAVLASAATALSASSAAARSTSTANPTPKVHFHPRIANGLGLIPPLSYRYGHQSIGGPTLAYTPLTYHGGPTMTGGVTVHAIFWAAPGYSFHGAPPGSVSYEALIEQYLTDVALAHTGTSGAPCLASACNVFTVLPQYAWGTRPGAITSGSNAISFNTAHDVVLDSDPYPKRACVSPANARACLTDAQVQAEVDKVIQSTPGQPRGLHNVWYVFLPPNVDECLVSIECGTDAFAGYHSVSNVHQHGLTIYAVGIDPFLEIGRIPPGADPQGNSEAELTVDVVAHEVNEAITDPEGSGWIDPTGFEVGDKCEFAPQLGNLLGYAPNGSPYNQVVNGDEYLVQEMWSNNNQGCTRASTRTSSPLPLPQVSLRQFSSRVSGNTENNTAGIKVRVMLLRPGGQGGRALASGTGTTAANGSWSVTLSGGHAVGDDRDEIEVNYAGAGAPHNDVIETTGAAWTGWTALDGGSALTNHDPTLGGKPSLTISPCFGAGELSYQGASGPSPNAGFCNNATGTADIPLGASVATGQRVTVSSVDDRAYVSTIAPDGSKAPDGNLRGALVRLTVPVAEPGAASYFPGMGFVSPGIPSCTADLSQQTVSCTGLVSKETYTVTQRSASGAKHSKQVRAQGGGIFEHTSVQGGDTIAVANGARTLTTLHVARIRVDITGNGTSVHTGTCSPGEYWGSPSFLTPPSYYYGSGSVVVSYGGSPPSEVCPPSGHANGLSAMQLGQTDELSGGQTIAEVGQVTFTEPLNGETMYGSFTAHARATPGEPVITLTIAAGWAGKGKKVQLGNVDTPRGVRVKSLAPGSYVAFWTVHDANGDTRTVATRFTEHRLGSRP
jgi:hypothetical protein